MSHAAQDFRDVPRRPTPTERLHAALMAAIDRAPSAAAKPQFDVQRTKAGAEQAKATGAYEFVEWAVHVPVCDEFPSADEAHAASLRYAQAYADTFPAASNGAVDAPPKKRGRVKSAAQSGEVPF